MTVIQNATGNSFSEVLSNVINQVSTQFSEGINGAVNGFRQFSQTGVQGFANNGQQQPTQRINTGESTSEIFKDDQRARMLASQRTMQANEVDFFGGPEDKRVVTKDQFGSV